MTNHLAESSGCLEIDGYTNRQSAVVHFDPDPEPLPHVALSSPNTIFVNDDDDNGNGTNDYLDVGCIKKRSRDPEGEGSLFNVP